MSNVEHIARLKRTSCMAPKTSQYKRAPAAQIFGNIEAARDRQISAPPGGAESEYGTRADGGGSPWMKRRSIHMSIEV
jgi:hypothetical protein